MFYEISANTSHERKWAYAAGIHPTSPQLHWRCDGCGRGSRVPQGSFDVTVEGGDLFPDILLCGEYPFLIVSERVVLDWEKSGIDSFRTFPVRVRDAASGHVDVDSAPLYFRIEVFGRCMVDFTASGAAITSICNRCGSVKLDVPYIKGFSFLHGSWDGSPLFRDSRFFPQTIFCTDKVLECARNCQHSNFRFVPVEISGASWSRGIDYLGKQWPHASHPLRPSEGKSLEEWVKQLQSSRISKSYEARVALLDLGKDAAPADPALTTLLDNENESTRREAAIILYSLAKLGVSLTGKAFAAAQEHGQGSPS